MQKHYYIDTNGTHIQGKTIFKHLSKVLDHHKLLDQLKCLNEHHSY